MESVTNYEYTFNVEAMLTSQQLEAFKELKKVLADDLPEDIDDQKILRFLIARKFDVDKAAHMLKRHLTYWNKLCLGKVVETYTIPEQTKYFPTSVLGFDVEGSLVRLIRVGVADLHGLAQSHSKLDAIMISTYIIEQDMMLQKERYRQTGQGGDGKQTYILDLLELRWRALFSKPLVQKFNYMLRLYEGNYPESLKTVYVVNAPSFFSIIYNFVKTIVPTEILSKVQILSQDSQEPILTACMSPDILPKFLGGTRTDEDGNPLCNSLFHMLPDIPVPEEFYQSSTLEKDPEAKKVTILAQSTFSLKHDVNQVPCLLLWDFRTESNDIGLSLLLHKEGEEQPTCLLPTKRFNCHKYVENGRFLCEEPGTYELLFDNSYSWWSSKELTCKLVAM